MIPPPPRIVVTGGGTAGWMAACLFAHRWPQSAVTVVESPDVAIVGVGEGSTPQLRGLFRTLGLPDADWMPRAQATYKAGIRFAGWSDKPGFAGYFHPFASAIDLHTQPTFHRAALARRIGHAVAAHPDGFFLNARIADAGRAPLAPAHFPFEVGYGYHFDAHRVGEVLRDHAIARGVTHLSRHVRAVRAAEGRATALDTEAGAIEGDLFVDASGFAGLIVERALGGRHLSFAVNLFNDRAVTIATPRAGRTNAFTTATALSAGWAWRIPLRHRTGNGYVFASRYLDPADAERELRAHLGVGDDIPARHLAMRVGRLDRSWVGNGLAIGLAQGFIEPLEATALHLVQATVEGFVDAWNADGEAARDRFNADIARRYEGVRDYIVAHYRLNGRTDTPYWRDCAAIETLSDDLKAVMTRWFTGGDVEAEVHARGMADVYAPLSWECLLAGYGTFPDEARLRPAAAAHLAAPAAFLDGCLLNFRDHDRVLADQERIPA